MQYWGIDILDLSDSRLSWPRLQRLIDRLPRESWTAREIIGEAVRWGESEHLLATLIDAQLQANWMFLAVHSKKNSQPDSPSPLRRPGTSDPKKHIGGKRSYTSKEVDEIRARMTPMAGGD